MVEVVGAGMEFGMVSASVVIAQRGIRNFQSVDGRVSFQA